MSCVGVMFAPDHQACADELVRVVRPGGRIGLISWTPEGFVGQLFATMKPFAPAPPAGSLPPPLWGDENHVQELLGGRVAEVEARKQLLSVDRFAKPEEFRDFFKVCYGPTIAVYQSLADDHERTEELDRGLVELGRRHQRGDGRWGGSTCCSPLACGEIRVAAERSHCVGGGAYC